MTDQSVPKYISRNSENDMGHDPEPWEYVWIGDVHGIAI